MIEFGSHFAIATASHLFRKVWMVLIAGITGRGREQPTRAEKTQCATPSPSQSFEFVN